MSDNEGFFHYLPVDDLVMKWGLYVTGAGRERTLPGEDYPPRQHPALYQFDWRRGRTLPEFQLVFLTDGEGEFESSVIRLTKFQSPAIVVLFPGVWHRYRPNPASGWTEQWLSFNGELAHRFFDLEIIRPENALRQVTESRSLVQEFDTIQKSIHHQPLQNSVLLSMRAMSLLANATAQFAEPCPTPAENNQSDHISDDVVSEALQMIWSYSHYPMSVLQIARKLGVSRRTLDRRFADHVGRSVLSEINLCRMARAKRLLSETDLAVKSVAFLAGFSSAERMRVAFLSEEETSPSGYRDRVRKESLADNKSKK
ncbi:MAG: AraC family transcriptional regulator [Pirellulaceae bacterium]|nr:AraC family transcriptional regulator [Planctomycetales bacterium]